MNPLFSVIIPTYNRAHLVRETLESVFGQEESAYEVIVVDDGSTDGTVAVLEEYGDRIRRIRQENAGPGAARNRGAVEANGEYLAFLDSDDLWFPWTLATYRVVLERNERPSFVAGQPFRFRSEAELEGIVRGEIRLEQFRDYLASSDRWRWYGVTSFVIRTAVFRDVGGFSFGKMNSEDADLTLRLGEAPGFAHILSPPTFAYRSHAENITGDLEKTIQGLSRIISREKAGEYPGGRARRRERREIIARSARATATGLLKAGKTADAWRIYRQTFSWQLKLGRWKYLIGFPATAVMHWFRRASGMRKGDEHRRVAIRAIR